MIESPGDDVSINTAFIWEFTYFTISLNYLNGRESLAPSIA